MLCIAGASGVVMYNHIPLESSRVITPDTTHGAAMLSYADGARVLTAFAAGGAVTMTFYNDTAVSAFSPRVELHERAVTAIASAHGWQRHDCIRACCARRAAVAGDSTRRAASGLRLHCRSRASSSDDIPIGDEALVLT